MLRWALLLALLSTSALASRADRLSVSPRLDRRDRLGATAEAPDPILLSLSLLPPDSECSGTPPDGVTFTRASAATCIDSSGVAHALTTDEARVHSTLGLLVEGSATNAVLHSRDVTAAAWTGTGCSKTATGMDGVSSVGRCTGSTSAAQSLTVATGARTASAYVRRQSGTCTVTLSADSESAGKALTGGWERIVLPYTSDGSVTLDVSVSSGCVADIDYVQDEAGSIATSPIVTSGTAAVRAIETATLPQPSSGFQTDGCAAIDATWNWSDPAAPTNGTGVYLLSNVSSNSTSRMLYTFPNLSEVRAYNGTVIASLGVSFSEGNPTRYLSEWGSGSVRVCEGGTCSADAPGFAGFPGGGGLYLGSSNSSVNHRAEGHLRNLVLGRTPEACQ